MEERTQHSITVDQASLVIGENAFICILCNEPLVLMWDGHSFSLRDEDANNPDFGTVDIKYSEKQGV